MKFNKFYIFISNFITMFFIFCSYSTACDIAVISAKATSNGRPIIWKSRDNALSWKQEVASYSRETNTVNPSAGSSVRVIDRTRGIPAQSGGVNEAGFAITNTTVYQESPIHEYFASANLNIMSVALKECTIVDEFDEYLSTWHERTSNGIRILSGNFAVIDAFGGAALYELTTGADQYDVFAYGGKVLIHKIDVNTGFVTNEDGILIGNNGNIGSITDMNDDTKLPEEIMDLERNLTTDGYRLIDGVIIDANSRIIDDGTSFEGFANRTNSSFWVKLNDDTPREDRAAQMIRQLKSDGRLTYRTLMQEVARDIAIDEYNLDSYPNLSNLDQGNKNQQSTFHTVSRYSTNLAFVVDGVAPYKNPELATMWISLGEPAFGVATPYFAVTNRVSFYSWADTFLFNAIPRDFKATCLLNMAFQDLKNEMYDPSEEEFIFPIEELTNSTLMSLIEVDWFGQPYEEAWHDFERTYSQWHIAYLKKMASEDTTDKTIRIDIYNKHLNGWILPLENTIMSKTEAILDNLRDNPSDIDQNNLNKLSEYCAEYAYKNIINRSSRYVRWKDNVMGQETYVLKVKRGSGNGSYPAGTKVVIKANAAPSGKVFNKWVKKSGCSSIANVTSSTTSLTMLSSAAKVAATYKRKTTTNATPTRRRRHSHSIVSFFHNLFN